MQASNTPKMTLDEDGDVDFAGTITAAANTNTTGNLDGNKLQMTPLMMIPLILDVTGADLTLTGEMVPSQLLLALIDISDIRSYLYYRWNNC